MADIKQKLKQQLEALTKSVKGNQIKLPYVEITNQEIIYKILIYVLGKNSFLGVGASHLTIMVDDMESLYRNNAAKLQFKPSFIYLPKPGRYTASYKERTYWLTFSCSDKAILTSQNRQIDFEKYLKIQTTGDSAQPIKDLINEAFSNLDHSKQDDLIVYENIGQNWVKTKGKKSRSLKSVILDKHISNELIDDIKQFIQSKDWYVRLGVPYRRSYLLQGPPGTGKSSFAQAIAGHLGLSLCFVNISDANLTDFGFNRLMNKAPKQSIILLQDVDAMFEGRRNTDNPNRLTYSGFLNSIDGVRSQEGRMIIMTTNHKQKLDPALLRPGRVDLTVKLNYATKYQVEHLYGRFFSDEKEGKKVAEKIPQNTFSMAQLQGFFVKYRKNPCLILENIDQLLTTEQNIRIDGWLNDINCGSALPFFKMQGYSTIASVKNLANESITALLTSRIPNGKIVRIIESLRAENFAIIKVKQELFKIIEKSFKDPETIEKFKQSVISKQIKSNHELLDAIRQYNEKQKQTENIEDD